MSKQPEKAILFSKFKLIKKGVGGVEFSYHTLESIENVSYDQEVTDKRHRPVHHEFRFLLQSLKEHLLTLTGHLDGTESAVDRMVLCTNLEMSGVVSDTGHFQLIGFLKTLGGKGVSLYSPVVSLSDGYDGFDEVEDIVRKLYDELREYMQGKKKLERRDLAVEYFSKKREGFTADTYDNMSEEDRAELEEELFKASDLVVIKDEEGNLVLSVQAEDNGPELEEEKEPVKVGKAKKITAKDKEGNEVKMEVKQTEEGPVLAMEDTPVFDGDEVVTVKVEPIDDGGHLGDEVPALFDDDDLQLPKSALRIDHVADPKKKKK